MEKIRDLSILTIYCAFIFYLSAQPHLPLDKLFSYQDKAMHLFFYALMGLLAWRSFGHFLQKRSLLALYCIGFCGLYGLSDEVHQFFVPGRTADSFDLIADITGATISVSVILVFRPAAT
ncbi:MAG: VanZ family protein [Methylococcales bacterium]